MLLSVQQNLMLQQVHGCDHGIPKGLAQGEIYMRQPKSFEANENL